MSSSLMTLQAVTVGVDKRLTVVFRDGTGIDDIGKYCV
jgi:hypothetical protein